MVPQIWLPFPISQPFLSNSSQINPVHLVPYWISHTWFFFFQIYFNIILPSTPAPSRRIPSVKLARHKHIYYSLSRISAMCPFLFNLITQIIDSLVRCATIKFLIMQFSLVYYFVPSKQKYLSEYPITNIHIPYFLLNVTENFHSQFKHYFSLSRAFHTTVRFRDAV